MLPSVVVGDNFVTRLAFKVDNVKLIPQISIHHRCIESILLARRAATILLEPLLEAVIVKDLLTVAALHVLL